MAARAIAGDEAPPPNETDAIPSSTYPLGFTNPAFAKIANAIVSAWGGAKSVWHELRRIPQFTPFRAILNEFNGEQQRRQMRLAGDLEKLVALAPEEKTQEAMFVFVEAGGDRAQLAEWRDAETRPYAKSVYDRALKLTDPQIQAAQWAHDWFDAKFQQGIASGVIPKDRYRVNYVPLNVEGEAPPQGPARGGKFSKEFSHAQERIFANSFELEHARDLATGEPLGLRVESRNLAEVMAQYGAELDRAELTREAMKQLVEKGARASTGEPLAIPVAGSATVKEGEHGVAVNITNPTVGKVDETLYRTVDHPAFKNWYWIGKGAAGENIFKQGYLGLHPEIFQHVENILSRSKIRNWIDSEGGAVAKIAKKAVKGYEITQQFVKQNMLGTLSVFHAKHEAIRAAGNLVAPWELRRVDPDDPVVIEATRLGLQLAGDHEAMQAVEEGLGSSGSLNVVGALSKLRRLKSDEPSAGFGPNKALDYAYEGIARVGDVSRGISNLTFQQVIPMYKLRTWEKLNARNLDTFAGDIAAGRVTRDDVGYLTSTQVNARFGHQNYTDIGRDPTFHHILSLATLAPDFWISNLKNYAQVAVGMTGAKVGREPVKAFAITLGTLWLAARILNKALDDDYHFDDPVGVYHNGRRYTFRSEVSDVVHFAKDPAAYGMARLAPFASSILEEFEGRNWRGEKVDSWEVLKELATKTLPMSLSFLPMVREAQEWGSGHRLPTSKGEAFLSSQGITVARHTPLNDAYGIAREWNRKNPPPSGVEDKGSYPVSKYQQLRYALEDGDMQKAQAEYDALRAKEDNQTRFNLGFHSSIFHPWTGTKARDRDFMESLAPADRAKIEKAEAHRDTIWERYQSLKKP